MRALCLRLGLYAKQDWNARNLYQEIILGVDYLEAAEGGGGGGGR